MESSCKQLRTLFELVRKYELVFVSPGCVSLFDVFGFHLLQETNILHWEGLLCEDLVGPQQPGSTWPEMVNLPHFI